MDGNRHPLALRIDVDFARGLRRAVPYFLDRLAARGMRATFFVVSGRNRPRSSFRRLLQPGYLRRLRGLGPTRILRVFGTSLWGGEEILASEQARHAVGRILDEGHELGVHGYDHAWWAEHAWSAAPERLAAEIDRGYAALQALDGVGRELAWGSPNWRTTEGVLTRLRLRDVPYFSDCWGSGPFVTLDRRGRPIPVPHLPINLPSFEGSPALAARSASDAVASVLDARDGEGYALLCCHDYFEGLLRPELFDALLRGCGERGWRTVTLRDAADCYRERLDLLPNCRLERGAVAGFAGAVSRQSVG